MPIFENGRVRIHYEEAGSGSPLLVIPGGGLNATISGLENHAFNPLEAFLYEEGFARLCTSKYDMDPARLGDSRGQGLRQSTLRFACLLP